MRNLLPTQHCPPAADGVDVDAQVRRDANLPTCGEQSSTQGIVAANMISLQTPDEQGSHWSQLARRAFGPHVAIDRVPNRAVGDGLGKIQITNSPESEKPWA